MKRVLAAGLLLFCVAVFAHGQTGGKWIQYDSVEGRYSVLLPGDPSIGQQEAIDSDGNRYQQHKSSAFEDACLFLIGYYDYEKPTRFSFKKAQNGIIANAKGTLISEDAIDLGGIRGHELKFSTTRDGISYLVRARLYNVGERVFVVQCIYPKNDDGPAIDAKAAKFFNSFIVKPLR
ncbi:MAG: hypothetical protein ABJB40_00305 [Acidobacteriota bacterium]